MDESSPDEAAGASACSAGPGSAGQSGSLSAKVAHPRLLSVENVVPGKADCLTPSLGHRIPNGTISDTPDTERAPASGRPGDQLGRRRGQTRTMTDQRDSAPEAAGQDQMPQGRVVVVGPDGMAIGEGSDQDRERPLVEMVEQPAKVMRIGSMIRQLLEEVRAAPLDEQGRARLREIHERSVKELESGLAPELVEELDRLSLPFTEDQTPSEAELRIAQAQLVGWLEGLFHGIQTTLFAQQMAARAQLEQMRRALPPGITPQAEAGDQPRRGSGPYL